MAADPKAEYRGSDITQRYQETYGDDEQVSSGGLVPLGGGWSYRQFASTLAHAVCAVVACPGCSRGDCTSCW